MNVVQCEQCSKEAFAKATWIGGITWNGNLCQECLDEMWSKYHGMVNQGHAQIILDKPG